MHFLSEHSILFFAEYVNRSKKLRGRSNEAGPGVMSPTAAVRDARERGPQPQAAGAWNGEGCHRVGLGVA
jgi:hypothetical protein